jgi:hypothetical protein
MEKENSNCKANMGMEVDKCQVQLAIEKEKYRQAEKHYHIARAFSWGFFILFLALYVTRI